LEERETGREDERESVSSYWMTLRKRKNTGNWKRKHWLPLSGERALEEPMDLLQDRLFDDSDPLNVDI
jgi:hypothetical protein